MSPSPRHLVLGATGGIGRATCRILHESGARLAVAGPSEERVRALAGELDAAPVVIDATDAASVEAGFDAASEALGGLDGAACLVGSLLLKPAHLTTDEEWERTLALNATAAFRTVRAAARRMRGGGSIVLAASAAARTGLPNHEAIAAAKGAVVGLTLSAAASYAGRGLRVNCIAPGLVRTPMTARITGNEKALAASAALHALGRIGEPEEPARAVTWLLDPAQSWVTGQVLGVDGGLGTVRPRG
jgi:NAD(P)-dependent dehydrogenase (short-subunit alcohol dehydrogenase family)